MFKPLVFVIALTAPMFCASLQAAPTVFKCRLPDGSMSYQRDPCPTGETRSTPTAAQLNAERQKKLRQAASAPAAAAAVPAPAASGARPAPPRR